MILISTLKRAHPVEFLGNVQRANVLLVDETDGFAVLGGTIEFTSENHQYRCGGSVRPEVKFETACAGNNCA